jgi:hypothetical protein
MRRIRPRFSIQSLMMVVVVVAGLLTLHKWLGPMVIALPLPCLAGVGTLWLVFRGQEQFAAFGFWVTATFIESMRTCWCSSPSEKCHLSQESMEDQSKFLFFVLGQVFAKFNRDFDSEVIDPTRLSRESLGQLPVPVFLESFIPPLLHGVGSSGAPG